MTLKQQIKEEIKKEKMERNRIFKQFEEAQKLQCPNHVIRKYEEKFAEVTGKIKGLEKALEMINEAIG